MTTVQSPQEATATLRVSAAAVEAIEALALASHFDGHCECPWFPPDGGDVLVDAEALAWIDRCCGALFDPEDVRTHTQHMFEIGYLTTSQAFGMQSAARGFTVRVKAAIAAVGPHAVAEAAKAIAAAEAAELDRDDKPSEDVIAKRKADQEERETRRRQAAATAVRSWRTALDAVAEDATPETRRDAYQTAHEAAAACAIAGHLEAAREITELGHRLWRISPELLEAVLEAGTAASVQPASHEIQQDEAPHITSDQLEL